MTVTTIEELMRESAARPGEPFVADRPVSAGTAALNGPLVLHDVVFRRPVTLDGLTVGGAPRVARLVSSARGARAIGTRRR